MFLKILHKEIEVKYQNSTILLTAFIQNLPENICDLRELREYLSGNLVLVRQLMMGRVSLDLNRRLRVVIW